MCSKDLLLFACLFLLGGLRLTSTTTTTTFVAAMSIANQDLDRYLRNANATALMASEDRIIMDIFNYAFLNYSYQLGDQLIKSNYTEEQARYGEGQIFNVENGKLVHITNALDFDDDTACSSDILGTRGADTPPKGELWIALVRRGRCTFEEKVKNVYAKGAKGVIIYNDRHVPNLEKMQIKDKSRRITAVITYQSVGLEMADLVDRGYEVYTSIRQGRSGSRPINTFNRTSVLFVSISFIVLMVISLVWLLFYYIQKFRYLQTKDQQSRQLCSVTKKAIMKIPTKTGKSSDEKDIDSDCCAICIEAYKASDCIRVLPCKHEFHKNCIDPWLIEHRTCPMCKLDVLKFYGYVFLGSEESILEYDPERSTANATAHPSNPSTSIDTTNPTIINHPSALNDLIRSRDFVIDFPRIFVLDAGGTTGTRESLFPTRLPERSQSSLSFTHAKDWMSSVTNKLEEQQGFRRLRRSQPRDDMQENLLNVACEAVKKRRSRSADGRYSSSSQARQQALQQMQCALECGYDDDEPNEDMPPMACNLQHTTTLQNLTETSYAQSRQRQREELQRYSQARRRSVRRGSETDIPLRVLQRRGTANVARGSRENTPPLDVSVTIQLNDEEVNLD